MTEGLPWSVEIDTNSCLVGGCLRDSLFSSSRQVPACSNTREQLAPPTDVLRPPDCISLEMCAGTGLDSPASVSPES